MKTYELIPPLSRRVNFGAVLLTLALAASAATAATNLTSQTNGPWNDEDTWDLGIIPDGSAYNAHIGNHAITLGTGAFSVAQLYIGNGSTTANPYTAGSLTIGGGATAASLATTSQMYIGQNAGSDSTLTLLANGTLNTGASTVRIGYLAGASGTVNIDGGTWTHTGSAGIVLGNNTNTSGTLKITSGSFSNTGSAIFYVGYASSTTAQGYLDIRGGSFTNCGTVAVGCGTSTGTIEVSGGDLNANNNLAIGYSAGTGFTKVGGGNVTVGNMIYLGFNGGTGTMNVTSGNVSSISNHIAVGYNGTGTLDVHGGNVTSGNTFYVGINTGAANGTLNVHGGNVSSASNFSIGNNGTGTLKVSGGSVTSGGIIYVGLNNVGGTGTMNVTGGSVSTINAAEGTIAIGYNSTGTLDVSNGGKVSSAYRLYVGANGGTGTANIRDGGTLEMDNSAFIGYQTGSTGTVNLYDGGTINHTALWLYLGYEAGATGTMNVYGGNYNARGLNVGREGTGTLNITGGVMDVRTSAAAQVGDQSTGNGILSVNGATVTLNTTVYPLNGIEGFRVGNAALSRGTIEILNGGDMTTSTIWVGIGGTGNLTLNDGTLTALSTNPEYRGIRAGIESTGVAKIDISNGSYANIYALHAGINGTATVNITDSIVDVGDGGLWLGNGVYDYTPANVTVGNPAITTYGTGGNGTLFVNNSTITSSGSIRIGDQAGAAGNATIIGSTIRSGSNLFVGNYSGVAGIDGTLTASGTEFFLLGADNGPGATLNLKDGTTLTTTGNFNMGSTSSGTITGLATLNLDSTSSLSVGGNLTIRKSSVWNFEVGVDGSLGGIETASVIFSTAGAGAKTRMVVDLAAIAADFIGNIEFIKSDAAFPVSFTLENLDLSYANASHLPSDNIFNFYTGFNDVTGKYVLGLNIAPVPEPSAYAAVLAALALLALALRRRGL